MPRLRQHSCERGFFEGRKASETAFDEQWYLKSYPDVANAIREMIASAKEHFSQKGAIEMRSPNAASRTWMRGWAKALARARAGGV